MRKVNLKPYRVQAMVPGPDGKPTPTEDDYDLKGSLVAILLAPALQLNGTELRRNGKVADKVEAAGETLLLEDAEYAVLKEAMDKCRGFGKNDRELVERILGAETINANAAPKAESRRA